MKRQLALWAPFVLTSALTVYVDRWLWHIPHLLSILSFLAVLNLILAIVVIVGMWPKRWPIVVVVVGLIIGQWWLVFFAWAFVTWSIHGFAP
jgi:hypothetical protein